MKSGILLLDKPAGLSSNAAAQRVRWMLHANRAGHVGSLDPLATGMLPVCLDEARKIAGEIVSGRKLYRFNIGLGMRTATGDAEGAIMGTAPVPAVEPARLEAILQRFHGPQRQIPPMYSALKREGQPLYKLARAGIEVERAAREITIFALRLLTYAPPSVELEVLCSKGTYVRTLAEDIAVEMGTLGHVTYLRRLYVEPFAAEPMETLDSIARALEQGGQPRILPPDAPLQHLPAIRMEADAAARVRRGQAVAVEPQTRPGRVRLYEADGTFMGLGEAEAGGRVRPKRLLLGAASS